MYFPTAIENGTGKNHVKSHMHRRKKNIHDFDNNVDGGNLNMNNNDISRLSSLSSSVLTMNNMNDGSNRNEEEKVSRLNSSSSSNSLDAKISNNIFQSIEFGSQFYTALNSNEADGETYNKVEPEDQLHLTTLSNDGSNYPFHNHKSYEDHHSHGNLASNNDYSSLYTSLFNDNKKRPRQSSISQRLRQTSDLESRGIINAYQKGLLKDLIMAGDQQVVIALDSYIMTGDLNRFNSVFFSDGLSTGNDDDMTTITGNKERNNGKEKILDNKALTTVLENKIQMQLQGQGLNFMDFDLNPLQLEDNLINNLVSEEDFFLVSEDR